MKWIILIFLALFLAILQVSFLPLFVLGNSAPHLILIASFPLFVFRNSKEALFLGFWGGLFLDFFSFGIFGKFLWSITALLIAVEFLSGFFNKKEFIPSLIMGAFAAIFYNFILNLPFGVGSSVADALYDFLIIFIILIWLWKINFQKRNIPVAR